MDRYLYHEYTILLEATRALAHIGVHFTHSVSACHLNLVSRPGLGMEGRPCVATWNWCRDKAGQCRDRARAAGVVRTQQGTMAHNIAYCAHDTTRNVRAIVRSVCSARALCTRPTCSSALCCALFGSLCGTLLMDIVLESLFKKKKRKKKYKMNIFFV